MDNLNLEREGIVDKKIEEVVDEILPIAPCDVFEVEASEVIRHDRRRLLNAILTGKLVVPKCEEPETCECCGKRWSPPKCYYCGFFQRLKRHFFLIFLFKECFSKPREVVE